MCWRVFHYCFESSAVSAHLINAYNFYFILFLFPPCSMAGKCQCPGASVTILFTYLLICISLCSGVLFTTKAFPENPSAGQSTWSCCACVLSCGHFFTIPHKFHFSPWNKNEMKPRQSLWLVPLHLGLSSHCLCTELCVLFLPFVCYRIIYLVLTWVFLVLKVSPMVQPTITLIPLSLSHWTPFYVVSYS